MRLLALWMACLLPASTNPVAASPPAVRHLSTTGTVWINAAALPSGSSVYNGDTVATGENALALLTSREEGRVEIRPDTLVSVAEREIALKGGAVGSDGLAVRVGQELVRPSGGAGSRPWFVVADRNGQKLVAAYSGSVLIASDGSEPIVVPEGFYAVPGDPPKDKTGAGPPGDTSSPGGSSGSGHWAIFSLTSGTAVAFIASLGATAVFASIVAYTLGQESVSPSN
jgi:hypothetical protein